MPRLGRAGTLTAILGPPNCGVVFGQMGLDHDVPLCKTNAARPLRLAAAGTAMLHGWQGSPSPGACRVAPPRLIGGGQGIADTEDGPRRAAKKVQDCLAKYFKTFIVRF
jgi:hypothetical protein